MGIKFERPSFEKPRNRNEDKGREYKKGEGLGEKKPDGQREAESNQAVENFGLEDELTKKSKALDDKVKEIKINKNLIELSKERAKRAVKDARERGRENLDNYHTG